MPYTKDTQVKTIEGVTTITISSGNAVSNQFDLIGITFAALMVPNNLTSGTTQIGFQISLDGATFGDDYVTSGALYTVAVPLFTGSLTSGIVRLPMGMWGAIRSLKLVAYNSSNNQVLQVGDKTFYLGGRIAQ